jgi:hypothetical protein
MAFSGGFDDMSRGELLDTADVLATRQRQTEVEILRLAHQWAVVNGAGTVDPEEARRPGRERAVSYGGAGTPQVAEFCGAALGARLGVSAYAGQALVADALDLHHRLPRHWRRVEAGQVKASYARHVARRTRDLDEEEVSYVDERVVEYADGRISWSRFEALVEAAVKAADPEAAARREEAARRRQYASADRASVDGMRGFHVRTHLHGIARIDATVGYLSSAMADMGATGSTDELRAMAAVLMANPAHACQLLAAYDRWRRNGGGSDARPEAATDDSPPPDDAPPAPERDPEHPDAPEEPAITDEPEGIVKDAHDLLASRPTIDWERLLPRTTVFVHVHGLPDSDGIARVEGAGTVTEAWLRGVLGPQTKVTVKPVIDLRDQAPVDAWEIPERHRQAVRLMTPADVFPFASRTVNDPDGWPGMQVDHTQPWQPGGGQSRLGNYGPMTARHHRIKTHGGWQVRQPFPGIHLWRDPHGATYLVDNTGTRRIRTTRRTTSLRLDLVDYGARDDAA